MKKLLLYACLALLAVAMPALAKKSDAYYTDASHPGRHWDCSKQPESIAYENDKLLVSCVGFAMHREKVGKWPFRRTRSTIDSFGDVWCKDLSGEACDAAVREAFHEPFYDSREKVLVRWKGAAIAFDVATTGVGIISGGCREANPIARSLPVLSLGLAGFDWYDTRKTAKRTPRFFSTSREGLAWVPAYTHTAAGLWNLFGSGCVL